MMRSIGGLILFISIFWGISLAGTGYVLWRLFSFWQVKHGWLFWAAAVLLSGGYILANLLDHNFPSGLSRLLLHVSAFWLGLGFISLCVLGVHDLLHLLVRFPVEMSRWFAVGAIVLLAGYAVINARVLRVRTVELAAPVEMDIVQLSDIHLGSVGRGRLAEIVRRTNALKPDLVLITGDLIDSYSGVTAEALSPVNDLMAPAYFTIGNHERYAGLEEAMGLLATTKVRPLRNAQAVLDGVQLIGIDDSERADQAGRWLEKIRPEEGKYTILMYHRPRGLEAASAAGVDLMLSGHTHNGQIAPFNWLVRLEFEYLRGIYQLGDTVLNVSTGTGYWGPPMRLGSQSEIVLIRLRKGR